MFVQCFCLYMGGVGRVNNHAFLSELPSFSVLLGLLGISLVTCVVVYTRLTL